MRRDYHKWYSQRLNRHMELLSYGHAGMPILVFPSSMGKFFEYEDRGMINAIWQKIENGHLQLFCVDSVDKESWYNKGLHPHDRVARHIQYENYVLFEVLPLIRGTNGSQQICATGCSFGAYHALNFSLKHPDVVGYCVAMSGAFDMRSFLNGYYDNECYFNNPIDYRAKPFGSLVPRSLPARELRVGRGRLGHLPWRKLSHGAVDGDQGHPA